MPEKKKLGRPTDNPKIAQLHVRVDAECLEILEKYQEQKAVTRMEAMRRGIKKLKDDLNLKKGAAHKALTPCCQLPHTPYKNGVNLLYSILMGKTTDRRV